MSAPLFSIVIPTFNAENFLPAALESVIKQNFLDLEIIVVDGASTDNTVEIARSVSAVPVQIICEKDRGIYDAMNKGVSHARGDLIGILGADDQYSANALLNVRQAFLKFPADIYAGKSRLIAQNGSATERVDEEFGEGALISGIPFNHNAMFATPDIYNRIGGYSLSYQICADAHWVHRAIKGGASCQRVDEVVVEFSLGGKSSTNAKLIMAETYQTIVENFPHLKIADAEYLLYAVRRWNSGERVEEIARENHEHADFIRSLKRAFSARLGEDFQSGSATGPIGAPSNKTNKKGLLQRILHVLTT